MNTEAKTQSGGLRSDAVLDRLRRVMAIHFDRDEGTPFWLERASVMGIEPAAEVHQLSDLAALGDMQQADLHGRPLTDFVPRRFHRDLGDFIVGQTGGTTGNGAWTAYRRDEFEEAFVEPFVAAARHVGFPEGMQWLFIGPTGPHIIGKAVRCLARNTGSLDPFCVDFDARWAKLLPADSFALRRYLDHVIEQAMAILRTQEIRVLFTTPVILRRLGQVMSARQREAIRGVHYGGMTLTAEDLERFQSELFPRAVHLSGYGNTLFGCCLELEVSPGREPAYFPYGNRLLFETIDGDGLSVAPGETGRVRFTRLDESMLIIRMPERDQGVSIPPPGNAPRAFCQAGILNPHVPPADEQRIATGLY